MSTRIVKCSLCGKEITDMLDFCNADPIVPPDENGFYGGCCGDCNDRYVKPARRILWPMISWLSEQDKQEICKEADELIPYIQRMSLQELENALYSGDDPLTVFRSYKKKCQRQERRSWWKRFLKGNTGV